MPNLILKINQWSIDRGLDKADNNKQLLKLQEELGELVQGHLKERPAQVADSVGDILVVLIVYCQQTGIDLQQCLTDAYNEIKDRKGKTINGVFIKQADLN